VSASRPRSLNSRGKSLLYPLCRKLSGPTAGLDSVEKRKFFVPAENRTWAIQRVAIPTELSQLRTKLFVFVIEMECVFYDIGTGVLISI
jgi:hypothetical protein